MPQMGSLTVETPDGLVLLGNPINYEEQSKQDLFYRMKKGRLPQL